MLFCDEIYYCAPLIQGPFLSIWPVTAFLFRFPFSLVYSLSLLTLSIGTYHVILLINCVVDEKVLLVKLQRKECDDVNFPTQLHIVT